MDAVDQAIVETISKITHPATGAYDRVYPRRVAEFLPVRMGERAVRYRMVRLAESGAIWRRPGRYRGYVSVARAECEAKSALARAMAEVERVMAKYAGLVDVDIVQMLSEVA